MCIFVKILTNYAAYGTFRENKKFHGLFLFLFRERAAIQSNEHRNATQLVMKSRPYIMLRTMQQRVRRYVMSHQCIFCSTCIWIGKASCRNFSKAAHPTLPWRQIQKRKIV